MRDLAPVLRAFAAGECMGTSLPAGGATHTEPVQIEYSEMMSGFWCPTCRRIVVGDETMERAGVDLRDLMAASLERQARAHGRI